MKVIIADDQKLLRDCMKHMIESNSDIEVVACAENGEEAIKLCTQLNPDLVLMDIKMPVCDGIEAASQIKQSNSSIRVLMLTTSQESEDVEAAIKSGADGYILKSISSEELILSIKSVYSGLDIIHKDVYTAATRSFIPQKDSDSDINIDVNGVKVTLSRRDTKIIQLIVEGKAPSEIAEEIYLTEGRVRNIISELIAKLSLKDKA